MAYLRETLKQLGIMKSSRVEGKSYIELFYFKFVIMMKTLGSTGFKSIISQ